MFATILTFSLAGYFTADILSDMSQNKTGKIDRTYIVLKLLSGLVSLIIIVEIVQHLK